MVVNVEKVMVGRKPVEEVIVAGEVVMVKNIFSQYYGTLILKLLSVDHNN